MTLRVFILGVLLTLVGVWGTAPVTAQQRPSLPSQQHRSLQSETGVSLRQLPRVNTNALEAEDVASDQEISPYRYGTVLDTDLTAARHGTWEQLSNDRWVWRLRIRSRDAVSLSVEFTQFDLPTGASLFLHGPGDDVVRGPYTQADATHGQHRTPLVEGEEIVVELEVPAGYRDDVTLRIGSVVHGYRSLFSGNRSFSRNGPSNFAKAGTCNLDVACSQADPWREQVRSVGRYTFEESGSAFVCSGSLVNNTAEDHTPYFLTAEHCISNPQTANSMVFYWNYQNPTCRTQGTSENGSVTDDDPTDQTSSGAILRARYGSTHETGSISGKPDLTLVEVDDRIPSSYNLYFSGWTREGTTTSESVTIHHPQGHGKRISFDEDPSSITGYRDNNGGDTHLRIGNWETGTTEDGSSGGPLYDPNQHIVGVLSGGFASCDGDGDADDNNQPDWYGRIAPGFTNGDYQGKTLADFLDPTNSGTLTLDRLPPDKTAPSAITDLSVSDIDTTAMKLQWTASGDDNDEGTASAYDLRYATTPIESTSDFISATPASNLPTPQPAGTEQTSTVTGLTPDQTYHFAIRTSDESLNQSDVGRTSSGTFLPDNIPPSAIRDFSLRRVDSRYKTIELTWTAPDDDRFPPVDKRPRRATSRYDLRYATTPIQTWTDFQNATPVNDLPTPQISGNPETVTVDPLDGLKTDSVYHFALIAVDNAGNRSPIVRSQRPAILAKDIVINSGGSITNRGQSNKQVQFVLNKKQRIRISLYDLLGRRVNTLFNKEVPEEQKTTVRLQTNSLSSGAYLLRFVGETFTETRKVMVLN